MLETYETSDTELYETREKGDTGEPETIEHDDSQSAPNRFES